MCCMRRIGRDNDGTEKRRFKSKLTIQKFLPDRGFEPPTLSCKTLASKNTIRYSKYFNKSYRTSFDNVRYEYGTVKILNQILHSMI